MSKIKLESGLLIEPGLITKMDPLGKLHKIPNRIMYSEESEFHEGPTITFAGGDQLVITQSDYDKLCNLEGSPKEPEAEVIEGSDEKDLFTIEDLREGKCAVVNDGTIGEIREVLKSAFPRDIAVTSGQFKYFFKHPRAEREWYTGSSTSLPKQTVKIFLEQLREEKEQSQEVTGFVVIFGQKYPLWEGGDSILFNGEVCRIHTNTHLDSTCNPERKYINTSNGSQLYIDEMI